MVQRFHKGRSIAIIVFLVAVFTFMAFDLNTGGCFGKEGGERNSCFYDQGKCSLIQSDSSYKSLCEVDQAILTNELTACQDIEDSSLQGRCESTIAVATLDVSACVQIEDNYWADNCLFNMGGKIDPAKYYCISIGNEEQRFECYLDFVKATGDPLLCNAFGEKHDQCILLIARDFQDLSVCDSAKSTLMHDVCIIRIVQADENLDSSVCEDVKGTETRRDCKEIFEIREAELGVDASS